MGAGAGGGCMGVGGRTANTGGGGAGGSVHRGGISRGPVATGGGMCGTSAGGGIGAGMKGGIGAGGGGITATSGRGSGVFTVGSGGFSATSVVCLRLRVVLRGGVASRLLARPWPTPRISGNCVVLNHGTLFCTDRLLMPISSSVFKSKPSGDFATVMALSVGIAGLAGSINNTLASTGG